MTRELGGTFGRRAGSAVVFLALLASFLVSPVAPAQSALASTTNGFGSGAEPQFLTPPSEAAGQTAPGSVAVGRYVRMQLRYLGYARAFNIAELEVFQNGVNIALGKPASESSAYNADFPASKAVDGNLATFAATYYEPSPWIQVDLGSVQQLDQIVLINRQDCCAGSQFNFDVLVSNDGASWASIYYQSGTMGSSVTIGPPFTLVFTSNAQVDTWDPIFPSSAYPDWTTPCVSVPAVGVAANWANPHKAFDFGPAAHPWQPYVNFTADWINAWSDLYSRGPGGGQSWTKYSTQVSGNGDFTLHLLADNCSWIYLDGKLVGFQGANADLLNLPTYPVHLNGTSNLSFLIWDGGGLAGGMYRLETNTTTVFPTTTTVSFGPGPFIANGSPFTATAAVFVGSVAQTGAATTITYSGDCVNPGSTCTATATYAGDSTHLPSHASASITIQPPPITPTTTTVTFGPGPFIYNGSAFTATALVSPSGAATIVYTGDCVNTGTTCNAGATYAGDANHTGSYATASITIQKAPSTTTVTFGPGPFIYNGSAFTATATVSPSGSATIAYTGDCTNPGTTCGATATYAGDANHTGSSATANVTITYTLCPGSSSGYGNSRNSGSTIPVKIAVCSAGGQNVGSASLAVKAIGITPSASLDDSGKANPGGLFRLSDGTYIFNLSTNGFASGAYTLDFTVGNDPTIYHFVFRIR